MEPQGRGSVSPLRTRRRNRALGLSKTTLRSRVHVQTVGLNAATKKDRHRAGREVCLLTFLFIGLVRVTLSAQAVDATPSGITLFSKVVFMTQGKRFGLSAVQKSDVWRRWKTGQSLHEIGRAFGKEHSSIRCLVSRHGGGVLSGPAARPPARAPP